MTVSNDPRLVKPSGDVNYNELLAISDLVRIFGEINESVPINRTNPKLTEKAFLEVSRKVTSTTGIIEKYFREKIGVRKNGKMVRLTIFEAIVLTLYNKALMGDQRALRALVQYSKYGHDRPKTKQHVIALYDTEDGVFMQE